MTSCGQQGLYIPQGLAGSSIACLSHEPTPDPLAEAGSNVPTFFLSQTLALSTLPCSPCSLASRLLSASSSENSLNEPGSFLFVSVGFVFILPEGGAGGGRIKLVVAHRGGMVPMTGARLMVVLEV